MASVIIVPGRLSGTLKAPPSKSAAHRALVLAALCRGTSTISPIDMSEDISATVAGISALGARCERQHGAMRVSGCQLAPSAAPLVDCGESGSTLRFLLPASLVLGEGAHFVGRGRLAQRPMQPYEDICRRQGIVYEEGTGASLDLRVEGRLRAGKFELAGDLSSQFISGLLMALPRLQEDSEIRLTTPAQSRAYIDLTIEVMEAFGVKAIPVGERVFRVPGGQRYRACEFPVEGDYSQAAVFLCACALGSRVTVEGLKPSSTQADQAVLDHLMRMGADIGRGAAGVTVRAGALHAVTIEASQCPDIVPILALTAALSEGETRITGAQRLRLKESDRLAATREELNRLGAQVSETPDGLVIRGVKRLRGGVQCDCHGDHRIAMMLCVAALCAELPIGISDAGCLDKSYPGFLADFAKLGGGVHGGRVG